MDPLSPLSLIETRDRLAAGVLDPQAAVALCHARAQALEPDLLAFAHLPSAAPPAGAGPLAGIAVGIKDLFDTADMPTTYGSPIYGDHRPGKDAAIVAQLRELGASVLGKTVTTEFAWRHAGPTRNPWNRAHTPGGSSSGSAAAVAAGIVPLAIGTQTFGSVIRPAAFCGIVGFKPSFGTLPREGAHPLSASLDHVGLFARSVADIRFVFDLLVPEVCRPDRPERAGRLRLILPDHAADDLDPAQYAALSASADALRQAGADVTTHPLPVPAGILLGLADTIVAYEAAQSLAPLARRFPGRLSPVLQQLVDAGVATDEAHYREALAQQNILRGRFAPLFDSFDAILTVPAPGEAPCGLPFTGDARFCIPWSVLGCPAVTLPVALGPAGLPLGLQLVGGWGNDAALLATALFCEQALPRLNRPPA